VPTKKTAAKKKTASGKKTASKKTAARTSGKTASGSTKTASKSTKTASKSTKTSSSKSRSGTAGRSTKSGRAPAEKKTPRKGVVTWASRIKAAGDAPGPWTCPKCGPLPQKAQPLYGEDERHHCPNLDCDAVVTLLSKEDLEPAEKRGSWPPQRNKNRIAGGPPGVGGGGPPHSGGLGGPPPHGGGD
jgi:hypothetical protein